MHYNSSLSLSLHLLLLILLNADVDYTTARNARDGVSCIAVLIVASCNDEDERDVWGIRYY